jgi:hypothetical protein
VLNTSGVHHQRPVGGHHGGVTVIDVAALRPDAPQVALAAGLLAEVGTASAAELCADLRLPLATVAAVLRILERSGRARRIADGWEHIDPGPRAQRRSWRLGGTRAI